MSSRRERKELQRIRRIIVILFITAIITLALVYLLYIQARSRTLIIRFPANAFNETDSITNLKYENLDIKPPYKVTINSTIIWKNIEDDHPPRIVVAIWEEWSNPSEPAINIVLYDNGLMDIVVHPPKEGRKVSQDRTSWVRNSLVIVRVEQDRFDIICNDNVKANYSLAVKLGDITAGSTQFNRVSGGEVEVIIQQL